MDNSKNVDNPIERDQQELQLQLKEQNDDDNENEKEKAATAAATEEEDEVNTEANHECDFAAIPPEAPLPPPPEQLHLALLPPDHPLLEKFQQQLKEYLLRTKEQLASKIAEMQYNVKRQEQEREEYGVRLYGMQQEIQRQNEQLEEYTQQIEETTQQRHCKEEAIVQLKAEYTEKKTVCKELKTKYNKRMAELEHTQVLENNIRKWTQEVEDELKLAKRIVNRDTQLQKQLSVEKRKSDLLFYHLDAEVKSREKELKIIRDDLCDMRETNNVLQMSISYANTDLEALQSEHKRLSQAWNEVIIAIQHRDKIMYQVQTDINKEKEFIKLSTSTVEAIKKQIAKEMKQNEKLEAFKSRLANDFVNLRRECQKESETLVSLEAKLERLPLYLEQTERDFNEASREGSQLETEVRRLQWKLDKKYNKKYQIEENILKFAQEHLINDKASQYRLKLLYTAQEQRRQMELSLSQCQNQLAELLLELEQYRGIVFEMTEENERLKNRLTNIEKNADHLSTELKTTETQIDVKMKRLDKLSTQLDELNHSTQAHFLSPTELKIKQLEKVLQAAEQQIREHQQFWIMLQNHYVHLTQKRNQQLNEIQVTRKQLSIIKQKSMKIDYDLENSEATTSELKRDIQIFTTKVEMLNEKMFKKRSQHENEESSCELEHVQLLERLRESEMGVLELEENIDELQTDIENYKDQVLDKHREALTWEAKYKLIDETIRWRKGERSLQSEIGVMKTEIHRMQIRHTQLKRAQDKLAEDLQHCVMHREQIFTSAALREFIGATGDGQTGGGGGDMQRAKVSGGWTSTQQKVKDVRNKLKQIQMEITQLNDEKLIEANRKHQAIQNELKLTKEAIEREQALDESIRNEIDEGILMRYHNLENIVRKQNRAKSYRRLTGATLPAKIPRSDTTLQLQTDKQNNINDNLIDVLQLLITKFPAMKKFFLKILQIATL